jgi:hypothetical protein
MPTLCENWRLYLGDKCLFSHDIATVSKAKGGRGKGRGKGKGSGRLGEGGKDTIKADVPTDHSYDRANYNFCSRCNRDHKGRIGTDCVMPPCRFCVYEGHEDSGHHLRDCGLKPDQWQLPSTLPTASKRQLAVREQPEGPKQRKLTALELVQTLSETELAEVSAAINTIHKGPEASATTSSDDVQEAIQALISFNRRKPSSVDKPVESNLQPDGASTTQLVPFAGKKAASITVVRHAPPPDQDSRRSSYARLHWPK